MKKIAMMMVLLAIVFVAVEARASSDYYWEFYHVHNRMPNGGTWLMVIDLDNDGWGITAPGMEPNVAYTAQAALGNYRPAQQRNDNTWLWDPDDLVIGKGKIYINKSTDRVAMEAQNVSDPYGRIQPNVDNVYALWFATPYSASNTGPGSSVSYGAAFIGKAASNYSNFIGSGPANEMYFVTVPKIVSVPEPVSIVLGIVGGMALIVRRKFGVKA
jgi:hypothetical protein